MFLWSSLAHVVLPLGETGVQEIPNESAVLRAMQTAIGSAPGLYLFPGIGAGPNATRQQKNAAMQQYQTKLDSNPSGLLIYHPPGAKALTGGQLVTEFLTELAEAFLAVFLLSRTRLSSFGSRVGFVVLAGIMAAITTNVPYWNWYGFPTGYTLAYMSVEVVGFLVVGIVAALVLRKRAPATQFAAA
jgi:hypothetical protein